MIIYYKIKMNGNRNARAWDIVEKASDELLWWATFGLRTLPLPKVALFSECTELHSYPWTQRQAVNLHLSQGCPIEGCRNYLSAHTWTQFSTVVCDATSFSSLERGLWIINLKALFTDWNTQCCSFLIFIKFYQEKDKLIIKNQWN